MRITPTITRIKSGGRERQLAGSTHNITNRTPDLCSRGSIEKKFLPNVQKGLGLGHPGVRDVTGGHSVVDLMP
jgi:hypothetical protein